MESSVATKGSPPVAFAARNENDWAQLVREPIGVARGSARTSSHQSSPVGCVEQREVPHTSAWCGAYSGAMSGVALFTWGSRKIDLAILQAVAGHRQVLPTHHTARKIISEPKKSHSRSGFVKKLTHRIACRWGDIPTVVDGRRSRAAMKAPMRKGCAVPLTSPIDLNCEEGALSCHQK